MGFCSPLLVDTEFEMLASWVEDVSFGTILANDALRPINQQAMVKIL